MTDCGEPPTPIEVMQAITALEGYTADGITYRGQKTHGTKVLDLAPKCVAAESPEVEFEALWSIPF